MKQKVLLAGLFIILNIVDLYSQRGATMPYKRHEAEDAARGNGALLYEAPRFRQSKIASEASGQKYVGLPNKAAYLEWSIKNTADGINIRFTMPDASDGSGKLGALDLYVNGALVKTIELTSYWAWQYFPGSHPQNTPGIRPRMRFDEVHFKLDTLLNPNDILRLEKNNGDGFEYGIDFIEMEKIPAKITRPENSYSVTEYGAVADDRKNDLVAFYQCIEAAVRDGMDVYIPEGKFVLNDQLRLDIKEMKITGAGMWFTEIHFSTDAIAGGGIVGEDECSYIEISNMYISTMLNSRFIENYPNYAQYKGFMDTFGSDSKIHHIWVEHFECGFWIADYDEPVVYTDNLVISDCRIRNNYADGVNFCQGTSNSIVKNCNIRNNGDDALAVWPNDGIGAKMATNNVFKYNTIEHNWRAGGIAFFGGDGHQAHHNIIKNSFAGSGIRLTTDFPGYHFQNTTEIKLFENTLINCGTSNDLWDYERGAVELAASNSSIENITFDNIDIIKSQRNAIQIGNDAGYKNINFYNMNVDSTGLDPYQESKVARDHDGKAILIYTNKGEAYFNNILMDNVEGKPPVLVQEGFDLSIDNQYIALTNIELSPTNITLAKGEAAHMDLTYSPSNPTNMNVSWKSSNPNIVSITYTDIYNAEVKAKSVGNAIIIATAEDGGHKDSCEITVNPSVNIIAPDDQADENGNPGTFIIKSSGLTQEITVRYTISGTADSTDYIANPVLNGSVILAPDDTVKSIDVIPVDDNKIEGNETVKLILQAGTGYKLGKNYSAIISIADDDTQITAPVICKTAIPISIDKNIDEFWTNTPAMAINNLVIGSIPGDFSAQWRALFDSDNLYILVEVSDTIKINDSGTDWWNDDGVEVFIDGDNSKTNSYDGVNDFQLGLRWKDSSINIGGNSVNDTTGIKFSLYGTDKGYNLEMAIPWNTINVHPTVGDSIGFDIAIDDDDDGGDRDAQITSLATSEMGWSDPSVFGNVNLRACNPNNLEDNNTKNHPIPSQFMLGDNYPNPFNPQTRINYSIAKPTRIKLTIYDLEGHLIKNIVDEFQQKGQYTIIFQGEDLPSGIYFYCLKTPSYNEVKRMLLLK